ncbi:MAG: hypothetical protein COA36_16945 [Desulfotalea sp.]|nr:MAG: hypothetical protein COA36_16945 [Desulfotalea sp.]
MSSAIRLIGSKFFAQLNNGDNFSLNLTDFATHLKGGVTERIKAQLTVQVDWWTQMTTFDVLADSVGNTLRITDLTADYSGMSVGDTVKFSWNDGAATGQYNGVVTSITGGEIVLGTTTVTQNSALPNGVNVFQGKQGWITGLTDITSLSYKYALIENADSFSSQSLLTNSDILFSYSAIDHGVPGTWSNGIRMGLNKAGFTGSSRVNFDSLVIDRDVIFPESTTQEFVIEHDFRITPLYRDGELDSLKGIIAPPLDVFNGSLSLKYVCLTEWRTVVNDPNTAKKAEIDTLDGSVGYVNESFNGFPDDYTLIDLVYFNVTDSIAATKIEVDKTTRVTFSINSASALITASMPLVIGHSALIDSSKYTFSSSDHDAIWLAETARTLEAAGAYNGDIIKNYTCSLISTTQLDVSFELVYSTNHKALITNDQDYVLTYTIQDATQNVNSGGKVVNTMDVNVYQKTSDIEGLFEVTTLQQIPHPDSLSNDYGLRFNQYSTGNYMDLGIVPILNTTGDYLELVFKYEEVVSVNTVAFGFHDAPGPIGLIQINGDPDDSSLRIQIQIGGIITVNISAYTSDIMTMRFTATSSSVMEMTINGNVIGTDIYGPDLYSSLPFYIGGRNFNGSPANYTKTFFRSIEFNTAESHVIFNDANNWGNAINHGGIRETLDHTIGYTNGKMFIEDGQLCQSIFRVKNKHDNIDVNLDSLDIKLVAFNTVTNSWFDIRSLNVDLSSQVLVNDVQNINLNSTRGYILEDSDIFNSLELVNIGNDGVYESYQLTVGYKIAWQDWLELIGADTVFYNPQKDHDGLNNNSSSYSFTNDYRVRVLISANLSVNGIATNYVVSSGDFQAYNYSTDDLTPDGYICDISTHDALGTPLQGNIISNRYTELRAIFTPDASNQPVFSVNVDFTEVATLWNKFAHGNKFTIGSFSRLDNWIDQQADDIDTFTDGVTQFTKGSASLYTSTASSILANQNCNAVYGAYSLKQYEYYQLSGKMFSNDTDNDAMSFNIAFLTDSLGVEHVISLIATTGGVLLDLNPAYTPGSTTTNTIQTVASGFCRWALVYDMGKDGCFQIDEFVTAESGFGWGSAQVGDFAFDVIRQGNDLTVTGDWIIDGTAYNNVMNFDISSNTETEKFIGAQHIGFSFISQTNGGFKDVILVDPSVDYYGILRMEPVDSPSDFGISELSTLITAPTNSALKQITPGLNRSFISWDGTSFFLQGLINTNNINIGSAYKFSALLRSRDLEV